MRITTAFLTCTLALPLGCTSNEPEENRSAACAVSSAACADGGDTTVVQDPMTGDESAEDAGAAPARGCNRGDSCVSGVCSASQECASCVDDRECAAGHICATFACAGTCGGEGDAECAEGRECCGRGCVDTRRDIAHCGGCNIACTATQFCGSTGCAEVALANICRNQTATLILNGLAGDDAVSERLMPELEGRCPPGLALDSVSQTETRLLNSTTGQPLAGGNNLLVAVGGTFGHKLVTYLEEQRRAPIYAQFVAGAPDAFEYRERDSNLLVVSAPVAEETETRGHFLIEVVRDPESGSLILVAYGYRAGGTAAAAWFLAHRILPSLSTFTETWYMYKWASENADPGPDAGDTFTFVTSGC